MADLSNLSNEELIRLSEANKNKLHPAAKYAGLGVKGLAKSAGSLVDLGLLPYNIYAGFNDKEPFSVSEKIGQGIDKLTGNKFRAENFTERAAETVPEFVGSGFGASKLLTKAGSGIGKGLKNFLAPKNAKEYAALVTAGLGTEAGKDLLPENQGVGAILGGLGGASIPGIIHAGAKGLGAAFGKDPTAYVKSITGLETIPAKGELAAGAVSKLQEQAAREKAPINELYKEAKATAGNVPISEVQSFPKQAREILDSEGFINAAGKGKRAHTELKAFESLFNPKRLGKDVTGVDRNAIEKWREGINRSIRTLSKQGEETEVNALQKLKSTVDDWEASTIEKGLAENPFTLEKFQNARKGHADWATKYKDVSSGDVGKKTIADWVANKKDMTPENIADQIFGSAESKFDKKTPAIIDALEKVIPDQMDAIRNEGYRKMFSPLLNNDVKGFQNNIDKYLKNHHTAIKKLYGTQGLKNIAEMRKKIGGENDPNKVLQWISEQPWAGKILSTILRTQDSLIAPTAALKAGINSSNNPSTEPQSQIGNLSDEELIRLSDSHRSQEQTAPLSQGTSAAVEENDFLDTLGSGGGGKEANYNRDIEMYKESGTQ
jgi:hypothetical protein